MSTATLSPVLSIVNGIPVVSSLDLADHFGKRHAHVIRSIQSIIRNAPESFSQPNFGLAEYTDAQGKPRVSYNLTRDGFVVVAMGFTGKKAIAWKIAYVTAFNAMESELLRRAAIPSPAPAPEPAGILPFGKNLKLTPIYVGEGQSTREDRSEITELVGVLVDVLNDKGWNARNSSIYRLISGRFGIESIKYLAKADVPIVEQYLNDLITLIFGEEAAPSLPAPTVPAAALAPTIPTMPKPLDLPRNIDAMPPHERSRHVIESQLEAIDRLYYAVDDYLYASKRVITAEADKLAQGAPAGERLGRKAIAAELRSSYGQHTHAMLASVNAIRSVLRVTATAAGMILPAKGRAKPTRAKTTLRAMPDTQALTA